MNLANAQLIAGTFGVLDGDNLPPGDLTNWFKWVPPEAGNYFFTTRFSRPIDKATDFKTQMGAFTLSATPQNPVVQSDLSAVAYLAGGQFTNGVGYEVGAYIAFTVTDPTVTYYIDVSSRDGSTGHFTLSWGVYYPETLGGCGDCTPPATGLCKSGGANLTVPFPPGSGFVPAGTFPPGLYVIQPCNTKDNFTFLCLHSGAYEIYSTSFAPRDCFNQPAGGPAGCDCINIGPCASWLICHTGGAIGFFSNYDGGNSGTPFPIAVLPFKISEQLSISVKAFANNGYTNGVDASSGYNYSLTVTVANKNINYPTSQFETFTSQSTPDVQIQLIAVTGGSGISPAAAQSFVLGPSGSKDFSYGFSSTATNEITGTFQLTDCVGASFNFDVVLGTSLVTFLGSNFKWYCAPPFNTNDTQIILKNNGPVPARGLTITFTSTTPNGILILQTGGANSQPVQPCASSGGADMGGTYATGGPFALADISPFNIGSSGHLFAFDIGIIRNNAGNPLQQTIRVNMADASLPPIPPASFNVILK